MAISDIVDCTDRIDSEYLAKISSQCDAMIDWDGTKINNHTLWKIVMNSDNINLRKKMGFIFSAGAYFLGEKTGGSLGIDYSEYTRRVMGYLKGMHIERAVEIASEGTKIKNLGKVEEILGKGKKKLIILSRNDKNIIRGTMENINAERELWDNYRIEIMDVIGNEFELADGIFTGRAFLWVTNKMKYLGVLGKPYFGDREDSITCRGYEHFHKV